MSYKVLDASSLEEAKELIPANGDFVVLGGVTPKINDWKDCEASSLPEELCSLKEQNITLVKITKDKIKFFNFPQKKSLCCTEAYHKALQKLK